MTIHSKFHRKNHHTDPDPFNPDAGHDPIASKDAPFRGTFHLNGSLSATGILSAKNIYVRDTLNLDSVFFNTLTANKVYLTTQFTISSNSLQPTLVLSQRGGGDALHIYDETTDKTPFIIDTQGRIGSGTYKPDAAITLSSYNTVGGIHIIQVENSGYALKVDDSTNDTTPFLVDKDGNVCIKANAPTPGTSLTVNGAISGNATLSLNGLSYNSSRNLTVPNDLKIGKDKGSQTSYLTIGYQRNANGPSEIDFYSDSLGLADPNAKLVRQSGINGNFEVINRGTGLLNLSSGGNIALQSNVGNVGIGTTAPTAKTEIYSNNSTGAFKITQANASGYSFRVEDSTSDTTPFLIDNNGNVCIKTNTPASNASLTVNGAISGNASLSLNGFSYNSQQNLSSPKNFYLGGSQGTSPVYLTLGYTRLYSGVSEIDFYTDNTGSATPNAFIQRNSTTNGEFNITNNGTGNLNLTNNSGNIILNTISTGGVGIGTTTPESKLHISSNDPTGCLRITQLNNSGYAFRVDDASNDATPFLIDNNGNVGVQTTNTTYNALTVNGRISATSLIGDGSKISNINAERLFSSFSDTSNYAGTGTYDGSSFYISKTGRLYYAGINASGYGQGDTITKGYEGFRMSQVNFVNQNEYAVKFYSSTFSMFILSNLGNLYSTGFNKYGMLGIGSTTNSYVWNKVNFPALAGFVTRFSVSNGSNKQGCGHCLAVTSNNELYGWGYNGNGQLGISNPPKSNLIFQTPTRINSGAIVNRQILNVFACSSDSSLEGFSYVTDTSNNVYAAGYNRQGQFGLGGVFNNNKDQPSFVSLGIKATKILAKIGSAATKKEGGFRSAAAFYYNGTTGALLACGDNQYGQLGNNSTNDSNTMVTVFSSGVSDIATSNDANSNCIALMTDRTIRVWGRNNTGELGMGITANISQPRTPAGITNIIKILSVGGAECTTYLLDTSGYIWASGNNSFGQLGRGNTSISSTFNKIIQSNSIDFVDMIGVVTTQDISGGGTATSSNGLLAAASNGELYYIGMNRYGAGGICDATNNSTVSVLQKSTII